MTREEAIEVIKQDIPCEYDTDLIEALNIAINALEHPERNIVAIVPCGDAISRKAVLDVWHTSYSDNREENEEIQYKKIAFELPHVTPERPKGEWIWKERIKGGFATYTGENAESGERVSVSVDERIKTKVNYCSVCGKRGDDTFFNFCPNCGSYNGQT